MQAQAQIRPAADVVLHQAALVMDSLSPDMATFAPVMIQRLDQAHRVGLPIASHLACDERDGR